MMRAGPQLSPEELEAHVRMLEQELADTNREVLALTLELDRRLEELGAAEERYRRLAENAPDVIIRFEVSPMLFCSFVNPRITELTGYVPDELYTDPNLFLRMVHAEDRPVVEALLRGAGPQGEASTLRWMSKSGKTIWVELRSVLVREHGQLMAIECIA